MASAVADEPVDPSDELMFLCLGGGNEVGRSCHVIQYKGKTVMVGLLRLFLPCFLTLLLLRSLTISSRFRVNQMPFLHWELEQENDNVP